MAVQANTRKADTIIVSKAFVSEVENKLGLINADTLVSKASLLENKINDIMSAKYGAYPKIENRPFYYCTAGNFFIADPQRFEFGNEGEVLRSVTGVPTSYISYSQFEVIFKTQAICPIYSGWSDDGFKIITNKDNKKYKYILGYNSSFCSFYIYNKGINYSYTNSERYETKVSSDTLRLPVANLAGSFINLIRNNLMLSELTQEEKNLFSLLVKYNEKGWLIWSGNTIGRLSDEFYIALRKNSVDDFGELCFQKDSINKYIKDGGKVHLSEESYASFVQKLINVDNVRINLSPYEESRLTDPNGGHWDLWSTKASDNETLLHLDTSFYGRNPVADVRTDGIVGIDFGTKSTVVTVQDGTETIVPMRIGCGDYKKDVSASDYENPTVMEFINLEKFMERYNSSKSRPDTEWIDLTISHTASETLNTPKSGNEYYAWFSDLKQWASDKNRKIIIKDKQGKEVELSPFVDVNDSDLNPIEYYAYLLGLFINNMYNGIYVNYILSFPVTYERKIRQKIAVSFSDGLMKSLPKSVQEDKNIMSLFRVMEGASEPAAYAVCALQEYGFKPEENEKILYGIFDFGGGTTDFDFGTWQRAPKKLQRRYDYVIKHFGAGGDRLLGGENLLELLAYSVFKTNEAVLRGREIQFIKPADADKYCGLFEGSEALISDSQQAKINQKQLIEELRPLWHGEEYSKDKTKINLYNTKGAVETIELIINVDELKSLIRRRIDSGVENFFEAMNKAVTTEIAEGVDKIHIFLAGNSSKSPVVAESFAFYKNNYISDFSKKLNVKIETTNNEEKSDPKDYFIKKYSEYWGGICCETESEGYVIKLPMDEIPIDDSFISKLTGEEVCELFSCVYQITNCSRDELINDLLEVWKEGFLPANKTSSMINALDYNNWDMEENDAMSIVNFIYSNIETSNDIRSKLENDFYHAKFVKSIADETANIVKKQTEYELFVLYPPLGTDAADEIRKSKGMNVSISVTRPTGKTGVAYGLLECRPGSRIKVESEIKETDEIKFNFYTGYSTMGKFEVVTDRDIEYGKWIEFIDASESDFELYYTDLPEAAGNQMSINGVSKKICRIDETMDDAMVYIRAVEPSVLEYCAAVGEEELKNQEYLSSPKKIILE